MNSYHLKTDVMDFHVLEAGEGALVLLLHGFPDLALGWTSQIKALAEAGYRVVAPDLRGYGQTGGPEKVESYSMFSLVGDVVAMVEALGHDKAVVVGHDWGAALAWQCALLRPDMFPAVMAMSVPFQARRNRTAPTEVMRYLSEKEGTGELYIAAFKDKDAHKALDADPEQTLRKLFWSFDGATPEHQRGNGYIDEGKTLIDMISDEATVPPWMSAQRFETYVQAFTEGGFERPMNWYRKIDANWHRSRWLQGQKVKVPAKYMVGEYDPTRIYLSRNETELSKWVPHLRGVTIVPGAGHWLQQERPETVNEGILGFLWEISWGRDSELVSGVG